MSMELEAPLPTGYVERWIAEARDGNGEASDRLFGACLPYLLAAASREFGSALRSRIDPADVVQDTLLEAWRDFPHFGGKTESDWLAWLRQILRNNLANERRRHIHSAMRSIHREISLDGTASPSLDRTVRDKAESPWARIETWERNEALEFSLQRLPEHYRQALCLHTQEGMTFAEVGGRLHCSAEAARKLYGRAAEELASIIVETRNK
jgi:RNA polymerase sigma-70 factor (subfamily 1)